MRLRNLYIFLFSIACLWTSAQQNFTVSINKNESNCFFNWVKINVTGNVPPYTFKWDKGYAGDSVSNLSGGDFVVHISDNSAPPKDTTISFSLIYPPCGVSFPRFYTPNSDGINDNWNIGNTEFYPDFLLQVFDRSGQLVHVQRHEYIPWEGTQLGIRLSEATYYYIFFYDEKIKSRYEKGNVTIIR